MRWLVVWGSAPDTTRSPASSMMIAAQPPGPGFLLQAPSV
jgi:hypothetical protein